MDVTRIVHVWNVSLINGQQIKVATVEQGERKKSLCDGCYALCCRRAVIPILNQDEFLNRKFPVIYLRPEKWFEEQVPRAQYMAALESQKDGMCSYFDPVSLRCTIWPNCPKSCLAYDCREDTREDMKQFAEKRIREWRAL